MPAVIAGGLVGPGPQPRDHDPFLMFHPLIPGTDWDPVMTSQAAYDAVWYGRGWLPAWPDPAAPEGVVYPGGDLWPSNALYPGS